MSLKAFPWPCITLSFEISLFCTENAKGHVLERNLLLQNRSVLFPLATFVNMFYPYSLLALQVQSLLLMYVLHIANAWLQSSPFKDLRCLAFQYPFENIQLRKLPFIPPENVARNSAGFVDTPGTLMSLTTLFGDRRSKAVCFSLRGRTLREWRKPAMEEEQTQGTMVYSCSWKWCQRSVMYGVSTCNERMLVFLCFSLLAS